MSITNYGELKAAVANWINRDDLGANIPDFIALAESEIYRFFAARGNEIATEIDRTAEAPLTNRVAVPDDYREALTFTVDERPLIRTSLTHLQTLNSDSTQGKPELFARELDDFVLWPFPDAGYIYHLNYYAKLAALGSVAGDADSNAILISEPGLFLYGSLMEAEPFLRGDQLQLVQLWKGRYDTILAGVALERDEEDRSGSNLEMRGAFGSGPTANMRTGRA